MRNSTLANPDRSKKFSRITQQLARWLRGAAEVAILGIGNSMRGDDFIGVAIVRRLGRDGLSRVHLIETGEVPESYLGKIEKMHPTHVLMIDAAKMDLHVGSVRFVSPEEISGLALSTHTLPLSVVSGYITKTTKAKVALLGIQPKKIDFGEGMSLELCDIVEPLSRSIAGAFELSKKKTSSHRRRPRPIQKQRVQ